MNAVDLDKERHSRPQPLKVSSLGNFIGRAIPERDWIVPGILTRRSVTLFSGAGGGGKTLAMMQLQVAAALGTTWFGLQLPEDGIASFALYCEDDDDEVHRRMADICKHYGCEFSDVADKVMFSCRVGEVNELMRFGFKNDAGQRTALYDAIENTIRMRGIQLTILDTVADIFMGNENVRPQVRSFITAIRRLSLINNGGVLMSAHPSRAGLADGSGLSGSTGWEGSVRSRIYLTKPKVKDADIDGEEGQTNDRLLKTMKSNYGPAGDVIRLKWEAGVFVRSDGVGVSFIDKLDDDRKVMDAARWLISRGHLLSPSHLSRTSLANGVLRVPSCAGMDFKRALAAQERLLASGRMVTIEMGPKSKRTIYVRPVDARYPGEDA